MGTTSKQYSAEVRERAVRMVAEHRNEYESQWAAIQSLASKIGCTNESLRRWVQQAERDEGKRAGPSTSDRERLKNKIVSPPHFTSRLAEGPIVTALTKCK